MKTSAGAQEPEDNQLPSLLGLAQERIRQEALASETELDRKRREAKQRVANDRLAWHLEQADRAFTLLSPGFGDVEIVVESMYSKRLARSIFRVSDLFLARRDGGDWHLLGITPNRNLSHVRITSQDDDTVSLEKITAAIERSPGWSFDQSRLRSYLFD